MVHFLEAKLSGQRARDGLVAEIVRERFRSENAAAAPAQIAAGVRHPMRKKIVGVDPAIPRYHPLRDTVCAVQIITPNTVGEAIS